MSNKDEMDDIIDEEDRLTAEVRARSGGVPMTMGGQQQRLVSLPTAEEAKIFSQTRVRTCGGCKHFRKEHFGDNRDVRTRFIAELVNDYEWRKEFLGDDPQNMGRCGAKDNVITGPSSTACTSFRAK